MDWLQHVGEVWSQMDNSDRADWVAAIGNVGVLLFAVASWRYTMRNMAQEKREQQTATARLVIVDCEIQAEEAHPQVQISVHNESALPVLNVVPVFLGGYGPSGLIACDVINDDDVDAAGRTVHQMRRRLRAGETLTMQVRARDWDVNLLGLEDIDVGIVYVTADGLQWMRLPDEEPSRVVKAPVRSLLDLIPAQSTREWVLYTKRR